MRILLLGAQGQLGKILGQILPPDALRWGRGELDLNQQDSIEGKILDAHPDIVINTASITDVDRCEKEREEAYAANAAAPAIIARACQRISACMVQISTDYVFGKEKERTMPYKESDMTGTVNYYGETKLQGEQGVQASGGEHLIIRVCGLYGGQRKKPGYVEQIIERVQSGSAIQITFDQIYTPTYCGELAPAIWRLIQEGKRGIVHMVNWGPVSRFKFTEAITQILGSSVPVTVDTNGPGNWVPRPRYSALDSEVVSLPSYMSDWRKALEKYIAGRSV